MVWFFVWLAFAFAGQGPSAPLGGIGVHEATRSMRADLLAQAPGARGDFSLGFTYTDTPLRVFTWDGFTPGGGFLLGRAAIVALAVLCALLPSLWFPRFDPARARATTPVRPVAPPTAAAAPTPAPVQGPLTPASTGGMLFPRLYAAELRILMQGTRWWWWGTVALLTLTAFAATGSGATRFVLPAAWIWPVLLWSRLGSQAAEHRVDALLGAAPARTAECWPSGRPASPSPPPPGSARWPSCCATATPAASPAGSRRPRSSPPSRSPSAPAAVATGSSRPSTCRCGTRPRTG